MRLCSASGMHFWERKGPKHFLNVIGLLLTVGIAALLYFHWFGSQNGRLPVRVTTQIYDSAKAIAARAHDESPALVYEVETLADASEKSEVEEQDYTGSLDQTLSKLNAFVDQLEALISQQGNAIRTVAEEHRLAMDVSMIEDELRNVLERLGEDDMRSPGEVQPKRMGMLPTLDMLIVSALRQDNDEAAAAEREANAAASSKKPIQKIAAQLERLIANLIRVRNQVKNPRAKQAIEAVILRIRNLGRLFDLKPPAVTVTVSPAKAIYGLADLQAGVQVSIRATDSLSGVNRNTLRVQAEVNGTLYPLSALNSSYDPVTATLTATLSIGPNTFPDGQARIVVTVADNAGNVGQGRSPSFTKDTVPPQISILRPADGSTVSGPNVAFEIAWTDETTSVSFSQARIFLDGSRNPILEGASTSTGVSTNLELDSGSHILQVTVFDAAGNQASESSSFTVRTTTGPIQTELRFISSESISGLAGTCTPDLIVQLVNASSGEPVSGLPINFVGDSSTTVLHRAKDFTLITDSEGKAAVRCLLPNLPGTLSITATMGRTVRGVMTGTLNDVAGEFLPPTPISFQLASVAPTLDVRFRGLISEFGTPQTAEFAGSAIPVIIEGRLKMTDGQPVPGKQVRLDAITAQGIGLNIQSLGIPYPRIAITDQEGKVEFAFELSDTAVPGSSFFLRLRAPEFSTDSKEALVSIPLEVRVKGAADPRPVQIVSGQGQASLPSLRVPNELVVRSLPFGEIPTEGGGIGAFSIIIEFPLVTFTILDGTGSIVVEQQGDGTFKSGQHGIVVQQTTEQGPDGERITSVVIQPSFVGLASIRYLKGNRNTSELITVGAGGIVVADTFVVPPPRIHLVTNTTPRRELEGVLPLEQDQANADLLPFRIEAQLPSNLSDLSATTGVQLSGFLASLDSCRDPLFSLVEGIRSSHGNIQLTESTIERSERFAVFRSNGFIARQPLSEADLSINPPAGNTQILIAPPESGTGALLPSISFGPFTAIGEFQDAKTITPRRPFLKRDGPLGFFKANQPNAGKYYTWKFFKGADNIGETTLALQEDVAGRAGSQATPFPNQVFFKVVKASTTPADKKNKGTPDAPFEFEIPDDPANTRVQIRVEVTTDVDAANEEPRKFTFNVDLGAPVGTEKFAKTADAEPNFRTDARDAPEAAVYKKEGKDGGNIFADDDALSAAEKNDLTVRPGIPEADRAAFIQQFFDNRLILAKVNLSANAYTVKLPAFGGDKKLSRLRMVGTVLSPELLNLPKADVSSTIAHEAGHVLLGFELRRELGQIPADAQIEGVTIPDIVVKAAKFQRAAVDRAGQADVAGAVELMSIIDEVLAYAIEVEAISKNGKTSWHFGNAAAQGLRDHYIVLAQVIRSSTIKVGTSDVNLNLDAATKNLGIQFLKDIHTFIAGSGALSAVASSEQHNLVDAAPGVSALPVIPLMTGQFQ